jgi:hypothetical protein
MAHTVRASAISVRSLTGLTYVLRPIANGELLELLKPDRMRPITPTGLSQSPRNYFFKTESSQNLTGLA